MSSVRHDVEVAGAYQVAVTGYVASYIIFVVAGVEAMAAGWGFASLFIIVAAAVDSNVVVHGQTMVAGGGSRW
ncbi:hypothetical protein K443DRAFT_15437 [Laccaria amethystina LaAM-08-1]|uniref:Uncharacterized protein n=1 Tax=Laccaria amethystina LaAM-08-1 TaxID=1095629 RepID=A0A0C9X0V8_9AGAR|nr:hypothetical protein K443DRAFT_15437 [Laccaria amethystina LaAM-08-1]